MSKVENKLELAQIKLEKAKIKLQTAETNLKAVQTELELEKTKKGSSKHHKTKSENVKSTSSTSALKTQNETLGNKQNKTLACAAMLQNKKGVKVTADYNREDNTVTFQLLNDRIDSGDVNSKESDTKNHETINFLKHLFGAKSTKSPYCTSFTHWSYTNLTVDYGKLDNIMESLKLESNVPLTPSYGDVARC